MADNRQSCSSCGGDEGLCGGKGMVVLKDGVWACNPLAVQVLGICSALAVTNKLSNSIVMGFALIFVSVCSNLFVSLLRRLIPHRIRMIAEVAIIATFVILFDQFLKAYYWPMSRQLGPYVGLIITNCIIMGRAEAFALQNRPVVSMLDGLANGAGYALALVIIGFCRELFGSGQVDLWGRTINLGSWYPSNQFMILAPGAFFVFGLLIACFNAINQAVEKEDKK